MAKWEDYLTSPTFGGFLLAYLSTVQNSTGEEKITTHKKTPLLPAGRLSEKSQNSSSKTLWIFFDASRRFNSWFQVRSILHIPPAPKKIKPGEPSSTPWQLVRYQAPKKLDGWNLKLLIYKFISNLIQQSKFQVPVVDFRMTWISEDPWGCLGKCFLMFDRLLDKNHGVGISLALKSPRKLQNLLGWRMVIKPTVGGGGLPAYPWRCKWISIT